MIPYGGPSSHNLRTYWLGLGFGIGRESIDGVLPCEDSEARAQPRRVVEYFHGYGADGVGTGCLCA